MRLGAPRRGLLCDGLLVVRGEADDLDGLRALALARHLRQHRRRFEAPELEGVEGVHLAPIDQLVAQPIEMEVDDDDADDEDEGEEAADMEADEAGPSGSSSR